MKIDLNAIPYRQAKFYKNGRLYGMSGVKLIVVHSMEAPEKGATAENVADYFARTIKVPASAHFNIDADSIVQSVRISDTAYHCKGANATGIGLEHAGYARQKQEEWLDVYGKQMLERSMALCAALCKMLGIPAQRARFKGLNDPTVVEPGICGHVDVPGHGSHYDPGPGFPWSFYIDGVGINLAQL